MKDQLKRILNLVRKTGDTMIVTDSNGADVYVVMGLDQYENLRNETGFEDEMTDDELERFEDDRRRENDWIWDDDVTEPMDDVDQPSAQKAPDIWSVMKPAGEEGETWDLSKMSDTEAVNLEEQYKKYAQEQSSSLPEAQEIMSRTDENIQKMGEIEEEFGEEQFYLEPIE